MIQIAVVETPLQGRMWYSIYVNGHIILEMVEEQELSELTVGEITELYMRGGE